MAVATAAQLSHANDAKLLGFIKCKSHMSDVLNTSLQKHFGRDPMSDHSAATISVPAKPHTPKRPEVLESAGTVSFVHAHQHQDRSPSR